MPHHFAPYSYQAFLGCPAPSANVSRWGFRACGYRPTARKIERRLQHRVLLEPITYRERNGAANRSANRGGSQRIKHNYKRKNETKTVKQDKTFFTWPSSSFKEFFSSTIIWFQQPVIKMKEAFPVKSKETIYLYKMLKLNTNWNI